nr:hypothetical protein [Actinomycetota bacterium]
SSNSIAPIILSTDEPVISLGGFKGADRAFTTEKLAKLVNEGTVRFFLVPDRQRIMQAMLVQGISPQQYLGPGALPSSLKNRSVGWVEHNCEPVPQELWQSSTLGQGGASMKFQTLYDCGGGGK